jgi:uncharacterized protein (TIGR03083 family)
MDAPVVLPYEPISHVRTDGVRLIEVVTDAGFDRPVPACPGWDLGDLAWHVGSVWNRFATTVSEGLSTRDEVRAVARPSRPADDLVLDWVTAAHTALVSALTRADPDDVVWTWAGDQPVHWVLRRMVHETAVHRWDAEHAVGIPYELPAAVAADGIDEFLMWFAGRDRAEGAADVAGTVHLHCTDLDADVAEGTDDREAAVGEWLVTALTEDGAEFTREHAKGDAAVRGPSHDLLMWCWRRDGGAVDVVGDAAVAERFRAFSELG